MQSNECKRVVERNATRRSAMIGAKALEDRFTAYGQELEQVDMFKYLGRLLAMDDNDMPAVQANLKKARGVWSRLSKLLRGETTNPRVCGMFYKAVVQSVLLYGSETWVVSGNQGFESLGGLSHTVCIPDDKETCSQKGSTDQCIDLPNVGQNVLVWRRLASTSSVVSRLLLNIL